MRKPLTAFSGFFVVSDIRGDFSEPSHGYYAWDTRYVSNLKLRVEEYDLSPLSYERISPWGLVFWLKAGRALISRERRVGEDGALRETVRYVWGGDPLSFTLEFGVRFESIFEVRGGKPIRREIRLERVNGGLRYVYRGIDGLTRTLEVKASGASLSNGVVKTRLEPNGSFSVILSPGFTGKVGYANPRPRQVALERRVRTDSFRINRVLDVSTLDLDLLTYHTSHGPVLLAGIPSFACIFGRDSILSALYLLPYYPEYALATLKTLGELQGRYFNPEREEEPGKIPHEVRVDELSLAGRTVFSLYYGSADATPLYVVLAGEYLKWTNDLEGIREVADNLRRAVEWMLGKVENEGYVTYSGGRRGLANQGWKDSAEGIPYEDGRPVEKPAAVVEIQGYAYRALEVAADIADVIGIDESRVRDAARTLYVRINREFWLEDRGYYALAIGGTGKKSRVLASNQGHLLLMGASDRSRELVRALFSEELYSGWGIRTLSCREVSYDPFSYHNGSIWPHDNAFIALGLAKQGFHEEVSRLVEDLFEAGYLLDGFPELFAGLPRKAGPPSPVPRANIPQAWSAASTYALITAFMGLDVRGGELFFSPCLPRDINYLKLKVKVLGEEVFVEAKRRDDAVEVRVHRT